MVHHYKSKKAFTLAEVLVTLGIIGVVAACTIPVLVSRYQEKVWLSQFQKVYNTISNAYLRASAEYGIANDWGVYDENGLQKVYNILAQFLETTPYPNKRRTCFDLFKGASASASGTCFSSLDALYFTLKDGALVSINIDGELQAPLLVVDINGLKKPNTLGKDIFYFYLNAKNNTPVVTGYPKWWSFSCVCSKSQKTGSWWTGGTCSNWVIVTGNMDYLHRELSTEEFKNAIRLLLLPIHNSQLK